MPSETLTARLEDAMRVTQADLDAVSAHPLSGGGKPVSSDSVSLLIDLLRARVLRAAHQERDADARRLAELVLRIRKAVRERGYLYVESADLYRDLDNAERLARAAIDAAMAADTQTEG